MYQRLSVCLAAFVLVTAAPQIASAQTVNIIQGSLPRLDANGTPIVKRPLTMEPEGISRKDCVDNLQIEFPLQLTGFQPQATLEGWASLAGADCAVQTNRVGPTATCWKVTDGIPLQPSTRVVVPIRRILAGASSAATPDAADPRLCGSVDLTTFSVQFLYFAPGQLATPAAHAAAQIKADTVGPAPPADVDALAGDGRVEVRWSEKEPSDAAVSGMNVYCAKNLDAAGTGCSSALPIGTPSDSALDSSSRCATVVGHGATRARVEVTADGQALANGAGYAFAVASVDFFGNTGALSSIACETPFAGAPDLDQPQSNEGSCAASPARTGGSVAAMMIAVAVAVAAGGRRRRRLPTSS
jgi:hypothetical protein